MIILQKVNLTALLFSICVFNISAVCAQQPPAFKYKADVQKIDSDGVYKIELNPDIIAKSAAGLTDIRIVDNTGKFVAYALSNNIVVENTNKFIVFQGINPVEGADTATVYIAENSGKLNISELSIKLKNTEVSRTVNILGSDDLKEWFAIREDITLHGAGEVSEPEYEQSLSFPTSNYRYFKIQVNGKNRAPVKILAAGIYTASLNKPVFTTLPPVKYHQSDSDKITHVFVRMGDQYQVSKLHIGITKPKYYSRRVMVYAINGKCCGGEVDSEVADTILSSDGPQDIMLSAKTNQIRIDIYNGDDNPLTISSVTAYQLKQYAVAYLENGRSYYLLTGSLAINPANNYDLSFLKNRAYNLLPVINLSAVYKNQGFAISTPVAKPDYTLLLWGAILLVLMLLSFLTLKMVREIKVKDK